MALALCVACRRLGPRERRQCGVCGERGLLVVADEIPSVLVEPDLSRAPLWNLAFWATSFAGAGLGFALAMLTLGGGVMSFVLPVIAFCVFAVGYMILFMRWMPSLDKYALPATDPTLRLGSGGPQIVGIARRAAAAVPAVLEEGEVLLSSVAIIEEGLRSAHITRSEGFAVERADEPPIVVLGELWLTDTSEEGGTHASQVTLEVDGVKVLPLDRPNTAVTESVIRPGDPVELIGGTVTQERVPGGGYRGDAIGDVLRGVPGNPVFVRRVDD